MLLCSCVCLHFAWGTIAQRRFKKAVARGGGDRPPEKPPPTKPKKIFKNLRSVYYFYFAPILLFRPYNYGTITPMKDKIQIELAAIANNYPTYLGVAQSEMRFWGTDHPTGSADDVVSHCMIQYAEKLKYDRMDFAKNDNHAQARFMNFVKNRLHNLTRKKYRETSGTETEAWTVDAQTFEQTLDLLNQAKGKLHANDTKRLARILEGESIKDVVTCRMDLSRFRKRVRKVYNAL